MKVVWEGGDLRVGRRIQKPDVGISGSWMVGYDAKIAGPYRYGIVSMADGQFTQIGTMIDVAEWLNSSGHFLPAECCPDKWMKV